MALLAPALSTSTPGSIGLLAAARDATILLPIAERDGILPSDRAGNLVDLGVVTPLTMPPVTDDAWSGRARSFLPSSSHGLVADDADDGDTLLTRDVTVQAILALDLATAGAAMTLISRGLGSAGSQRYAYGVDFIVSATPGEVAVRMFWQEPGGIVRAAGSATFSVPGSAPFLLTVTRRWVSSSEVVCRYYVGGELLAEVTSVYGSIGGGTTGTTTVGVRCSSGTTYERFLSGRLEELLVVPYEMSKQEVAATWKRIAVHQPQGAHRMRALAPPGAPWSRTRGNRIDRLVRSVGDILGHAAARADELLEAWLPDGTYLDLLPRWEKLLAIGGRSRDSLDVRRERVVSALQRQNGYSVPKIRELLAGPLRLDPDDVELLEFTPTVTDDFTTLAAERWHTAGPTGAYPPGESAWSIAGGALRLYAPSGSDLRWDATIRVPIHARTPLFTLHGPEREDPRLGAIVQGKLATFWAALPASTIVGLFLYDFRTGDALWFGVYNDAGTRKLAWRQLKDNVLGAVQVLAASTVNAPYWLRITQAGGAGSYTLNWDTTGFTSMAGVAQISGAIETPDYCGFGAMCSDAATAAILTATFDDFLGHAPQGERAFAWYVMADLVTNPDLAGADRVVRRARPAHTHAAVITSVSMLCDEPLCGCDGGPLGGL